MNVFIRAIVRILSSFGERLIVPFNEAIAEFSLSPREDILTFALINIHYLYTINTIFGFYYITITAKF